MASLQTDVVVVGGGASGLAAAISAATEGAKVLLTEKNPYLGGSARLSVGSINAAGSSLQKRVGITDTPDEHFADMDHFMGPWAALENRELRRILVDNVAGTLDWLMAMGLRFYGPTADPPHRHARMHNVLPNSRAYPWYLGREARRRGVQIMLDAPLESILGDTGGATGVVACIEGERTEIHARLGVILASGDYSNGRELKREFRPELEAVSAVNPTATGDGQRIARQFGARIVNGQVIWGPSLRFAEPATPSLVRRLPPVPLLVGAMDLATSPMRRRRWPRWLTAWACRPTRWRRRWRRTTRPLPSTRRAAHPSRRRRSMRSGRCRRASSSPMAGWRSTRTTRFCARRMSRSRACMLLAQPARAVCCWPATGTTSAGPRRRAGAPGASSCAVPKIRDDPQVAIGLTIG